MVTKINEVGYPITNMTLPKRFWGINNHKYHYGN